MSKLLLHFNQHDHYLTKVIAKATVPVNIPVSDIRLNAVIHLRDPSVDEDVQWKFGPAVFFKFEGAYVPLVGIDAIKRRMQDGAVTINGRLISSPALKMCRKEQYVAAAALPVQEPERGYPARNNGTGYHRKFQGSGGYNRQESTPSPSRARGQYGSKRDD